MRVIILGSAAGGGVPQWNCGCPNCTDARHDNRSRTQSSVAVSADGERWILLNASPDLRMQLAAHHELWPRGRRGSGVGAVILTDGEIDDTLGLLLMRESPAKLPVYAPGGVAALSGALGLYLCGVARAGRGSSDPPHGPDRCSPRDLLRRRRRGPTSAALRPHGVPGDVRCRPPA